MWELGSQFRRACINGNGARWRAQIGVENTQKKIQSEPIFRGFWIAPFWESWDLGVVSPLPLVYCYQRLSGNLRNNLWRSATYGQSLGSKAVSLFRLLLMYTAIALAIICSFGCGAQGQMSHSNQLCCGNFRNS